VPSNDITVIPRFVKTGQVVQMYKCEGQTRKGTRAPWSIKIIF